MSKAWLEKIRHFFSPEPKNKTELFKILRRATEKQLLDNNTFSMLEGVFEVQELRVNDIMIPRAQMVIIDQSMPLDKILPIVIKSGHSRFPVIGDNKDEILGILLAKDLLNYTFNNNNKPFAIKQILRQAVFIPESKRLDVLLQEFRVKQNHMAIVVDEYGGVTGLVTIENVLEQIVGDIEDEYDINSSNYIRNHSDSTYTVKALTPLEDFNEYFHCYLPEDKVETIGGYLMRYLGRLPEVGEFIDIDQFRFKILRADNRRIYLLQVITS